MDYSVITRDICLAIETNKGNFKCAFHCEGKRKALFLSLSVTIPRSGCPSRSPAKHSHKMYIHLSQNNALLVEECTYLLFKKICTRVSLFLYFASRAVFHIGRRHRR